MTPPLPLFLPLSKGRDEVTIDTVAEVATEVAAKSGLNAPCVTLYSSLCGKDRMTRMSDAHSPHEPLPPKDLRPFMTDAMSFACSIVYFLLVRCSKNSGSFDGGGSMPAELNKKNGTVIDGLRLL